MIDADSLAMGLRNGTRHTLLLQLASLLTRAIALSVAAVRCYGHYKCGGAEYGMHFATCRRVCARSHGRRDLDCMVGVVLNAAALLR